MPTYIQHKVVPIGPAAVLTTWLQLSLTAVNPNGTVAFDPSLGFAGFTATHVPRSTPFTKGPATVDGIPLLTHPPPGWITIDTTTLLLKTHQPRLAATFNRACLTPYLQSRFNLHIHPEDLHPQQTFTITSANLRYLYISNPTRAALDELERHADLKVYSLSTELYILADAQLQLPRGQWCQLGLHPASSAPLVGATQVVGCTPANAFSLLGFTFPFETIEELKHHGIEGSPIRKTPQGLVLQQLEFTDPACIAPYHPQLAAFPNCLITHSQHVSDLARPNYVHIEDAARLPRACVRHEHGRLLVHNTITGTTPITYVGLTRFTLNQIAIPLRLLPQGQILCPPNLLAKHLTPLAKAKQGYQIPPSLSRYKVTVETAREDWLPGYYVLTSEVAKLPPINRQRRRRERATRQARFLQRYGHLPPYWHKHTDEELHQYFALKEQQTCGDLIDCRKHPLIAQHHDFQLVHWLVDHNLATYCPVTHCVLIAKTLSLAQLTATPAFVDNLTRMFGGWPLALATSNRAIDALQTPAADPGLPPCAHQLTEPRQPTAISTDAR